jgi:predicted transcriptional regulator
MKDMSFTIRLDPETHRLLARLSRSLRQSRSAIAREALRRQLRLLQFESLRSRALPSAQARGLITDEDAFDRIS